jgi:hypothetical protein
MQRHSKYTHTIRKSQPFTNKKTNKNIYLDININVSSKDVSIVLGSGIPDRGLEVQLLGKTMPFHIPHTLTSGNPEKGPNGIFDSGIMNADKSFSQTLYKAGILEYYCAIHRWMRGKIMVQ